MIKLSTSDIKRAAESLSFRQASEQQQLRDVERLTDAEVDSASEYIKLSGLSKKQVYVADQLGRSLAHQKMAAGPGIMQAAKKAVKPLLTSAKKSLTLGRTRAQFDPIRKGRKTLKGLEAAKHRFRQRPGQVVKQVAKDVVPVAGAGYMGTRALSSNGQ